METVKSKLKFVHYLNYCVLTSSGKALPKWGYNQQEVSCNPNMRDKNALWNIEDNHFAKCKLIAKIQQKLYINRNLYLQCPMSVFKYMLLDF